MRKLLHKRKRNEKDKWTYKLGSKLGSQLNMIFSNKRVKWLIAIAFVLVLFIFIVPFQNNIITVFLLVLLLIISYILKKVAKK